jgi:cytochrome c oxidase subunit 2
MYELTEIPLAAPRLVQISAKRWKFEPETIELQKGEPVTLALSSSDVHHGFNAPGLGLHAELLPGQVAHLQITPRETGVFPFHCDFYCGEGHEGMEGTIVVR